MLKISAFKLIPGAYIPDVSGVSREFRRRRSKLILSLSAEDYPAFFTKAVKLLGDRVFFFVEIPSDDDKMRTYYLDNCTASVAQAILKRYGELLYADGVIKFGFGSHDTDDEIYMQEYQTLTVFSRGSLQKYAGLLEALGYKENDKAILTWDVIGEGNAGECVNVDVDGEGYHDMINNLIDVGMYPAKD